MSFIKNVINILTDTRDIKEPIIYKDIEENSHQQNSLMTLKENNEPNLDPKKIEDHLKLFSIGHTGEKSVMFELQHSMLPLLILHDINLEVENYKAQFDFIMITHKFILVLEVKKLFGNIRITDKGEFQRVITKNNRTVNKEGMYSPINQVERHVDILEKFLISKGIITKCPIRGAVTFANPKTIIDMSPNAPASIQSRVIRHDQIKPFIKNELDKKSPVNMLDKHLHDIAQVILQHNIEPQFDASNYMLEKFQTTKNTTDEVKPVMNKTKKIINEQLKTSLINYRLQRSKELNIKPFYIFTNKILDELLEKKPLTSDQLLQIEGIGPTKVEEYGDDILSIIKLNGSDLLRTSTFKDSSRTKIHNLKKNDSLKEALMILRTEKAQELTVKPFYIFTNKTLDDLLSKKPKSNKELLNVEGFGPKKVEEFGEDIIKVFNQTFD